MQNILARSVVAFDDEIDAVLELVAEDLHVDGNREVLLSGVVRHFPEMADAARNTLAHLERVLRQSAEVRHRLRVINEPITGWRR